MDTEDDPAPAVGLTGARFGGAPRRRKAIREAAREAARERAEAEVAAPVAEPDADTAALPAVGPGGHHHGGARQHGAPAPAAGPPPHPGVVHHHDGQPSGTERVAGQPDGPLATEVPDGPAVGLTGARFGGARRPRRTQAGPRAEDRGGPGSAGSGAAAVEPAGGSPLQSAPDHGAPPREEPEPVVGGSAFVRPYVFTGGRTRSSLELSVETLVSAVSQAVPTGLDGEHGVVLGLCREPRSVAELAAGARVPLGVARVLVGDLAAAGAVAVHRSSGDGGPDLALMQRVLSGLRRL